MVNVSPVLRFSFCRGRDYYWNKCFGKKLPLRPGLDGKNTAAISGWFPVFSASSFISRNALTDLNLIEALALASTNLKNKERFPGQTNA